MSLHLKWIGGLLIMLAFLHAIFPKYFDWKQDLSSLQLINRQVMYVHTFFIALTIALGSFWESQSPMTTAAVIASCCERRRGE